MQVHYGFDVDAVVTHAVNDGVREALEVERAIVTPNDAPAFRFDDNAARCAFEFVEEVIAQTRLPLFIPKHGAFQFLLGFRMADDVHEAWCERPE